MIDSNIAAYIVQNAHCLTLRDIMDEFELGSDGAVREFCSQMRIRLLSVSEQRDQYIREMSVHCTVDAIAKRIRLPREQILIHSKRLGVKCQPENKEQKIEERAEELGEFWKRETGSERVERVKQFVNVHHSLLTAEDMAAECGVNKSIIERVCEVLGLKAVSKDQQLLELLRELAMKYTKKEIARKLHLRMEKVEAMADEAGIALKVAHSTWNSRSPGKILAMTTGTTRDSRELFSQVARHTKKEERS